MALPKKEGGIRVRDFFATNTTGLVKRAVKCWSPNNSIFTDWIKIRYIKGKGVDDIRFRPNIDSHMWKTILANRETINSCIKCLSNHRTIQLYPLPHSETLRHKGTN